MNITSKLSLYNTLCMFVCGYLIACVCFKTLENEGNISFYIFCYVIGLVYHRLIEILFPCARNNLWMIRKSRDKVVSETNAKLPSATKRNYYEAYYFLMKVNGLYNIPMLEAQAAFCKDMFILLVGIIIATKLHFLDITWLVCHSCYYSVYLLIVTLLFIPIWFFIQMKVHYLVWETHYHFKRIKDTESYKVSHSHNKN